MIDMAALGAALGLALVGFGLPLGRDALRPRVEPYVTGLRGRPALGKRAAAMLTRGFERAGIEDREALEKRLERAGCEVDVPGFRFQQLLWGIGAGAGACGLLSALAAAGAEVRAAPVSIAVIVAFVTGAAARDWWLGRCIHHRLDAMSEELPAAIDLLTIAVTAGEAVPAAFERAAATVGGVIADELQRTVNDLRSGTSIIDALDGLERRVPIHAVARVVSALQLGLEHGSPLAEVLHAQAADAREERRRAMIESAGKREVMMLVPVVFIIMPVVVLFALYPGLVSLESLVP